MVSGMVAPGVVTEVTGGGRADSALLRLAWSRGEIGRLYPGLTPWAKSSSALRAGKWDFVARAPSPVRSGAATEGVSAVPAGLWNPCACQPASKLAGYFHPRLRRGISCARGSVAVYARSLGPEGPRDDAVACGGGARPRPARGEAPCPHGQMQGQAPCPHDR